MLYPYLLIGAWNPFMPHPYMMSGPGGAWSGYVAPAETGATTVNLHPGGTPPATKSDIFQTGQALAIMAGPSAGAVVRLNALTLANGTAGGTTVRQRQHCFGLFLLFVGRFLTRFRALPHVLYPPPHVPCDACM